MSKFKIGDRVICITKHWEIVKGNPKIFPVFNKIYTVSLCHPSSAYICLEEAEYLVGHDEEGFEKIPSDKWLEQQIAESIKSAGTAGEEKPISVQA